MIRSSIVSIPKAYLQEYLDRGKWCQCPHCNRCPPKAGGAGHRAGPDLWLCALLRANRACPLGSSRVAGVVAVAFVAKAWFAQLAVWGIMGVRRPGKAWAAVGAGLIMLLILSYAMRGGTLGI